MLPVAHGLAMTVSGLTAFTRGSRSLDKTFADIVFPSIRFRLMGCSQSSAWMLAGRSPWALHVSASVARRIRLPTHGGCFRVCNRQGKWGLALRLL